MSKGEFNYVQKKKKKIEKAPRETEYEAHTKPKKIK